MLWFSYLSLHQHGYLYALPLILSYFLLLKKFPELLHATFPLRASVPGIVSSNTLSSAVCLFYPSLNCDPSLITPSLVFCHCPPTSD